MQTGESQTMATEPLQRCTIRTTSGRYVTDGIVVLIARPGETEARITELTEPGALLMAFVGRGTQRFIIDLDDGREFESELLGTSWQPPGRRLCRFALAAPVQVG